MPRANIDLSWLYPLLAKNGGAPQINPAAGGVDMNDQGQFYNIVTGHPLTDDEAFAAPVDQEYLKPSLAMRMFNPQQASWIDQQNAQYAAAPFNAANARDVQRLMSSKDWATLTPEQQQALGGNMANAITTTGGNFTSPAMRGVIAANSDISNQVPQLSSQEEAQRIKQAIDTANAFGNAGGPQNRGVSDALGLARNIAVDSNFLNNLPTWNKLQDTSLANQLWYQENNAPANNRLSLLQTNSDIPLAQQQVDSAELRKMIAANNMMKEAYGSSIMDATQIPMLANTVDATGIHPFTGVNSLAASPYTAAMMMLNNMNGGAGGPILNGKSIIAINGKPIAANGPVGWSPYKQAPTASKAADNAEMSKTPPPIKQPIARQQVDTRPIPFYSIPKQETIASQDIDLSKIKDPAIRQAIALEMIKPLLFRQNAINTRTY